MLYNYKAEAIQQKNRLAWVVAGSCKKPHNSSYQACIIGTATPFIQAFFF